MVNTGDGELKSPERHGKAGGRLVALTGPTAVGKTELSLQLAQALGGEVVSADSLQVYRGMDIGTAKAACAERRRVVHHLLDVRDPDETMNVATYQDLARRAIAGIHARGRLPLLVGGTGLYLRAVIQDYAFGRAEPNQELRARLKARAAAEGQQALHRELAQLDPASADTIHPHDLRRTIRALEYYHTTGEPISAQQQAEPHFVYDHLTFILNRERQALYDRINRRCEAMLAAGLVQEVQGLLAEGYAPELPPMQALGYRHVLAHLLRDEPLSEALERFQQETRRFAKRQLTWFRSEEPACWISLDDGEQAALARVLAACRSRWPDLQPV